MVYLRSYLTIREVNSWKAKIEMTGGREKIIKNIENGEMETEGDE